MADLVILPLLTEPLPYVEACFQVYVKDFIPSVNEIFLKFGLSSNFSISDCVANLFIVNCENPQENILFLRSPQRWRYDRAEFHQSIHLNRQPRDFDSS